MMVEIRTGPLREVVDVVRSFVTEWDAFVRQVDTLTREHEQLLTRCTSLDRQLHELQESYERLRQQHDADAEALGNLRSAHEALLREHDGAIRAQHELRERYELLEHNRLDAAEQLEAVLRALKP